MDFDALRTERRDIRDFVNLHEASVLEFVGDGKTEPDGKASYAACSWFKLTIDEVVVDNRLRPPHLSTSASCLESLADAQIGHMKRLAGDRLALARNFSTRALSADPRTWRSEGAADVDGLLAGAAAAGPALKDGLQQQHRLGQCQAGRRRFGFCRSKVRKP